MKYWMRVGILLILLITIISTGMVFSSEKQVPNMVVVPLSGEPGTKLTFYGAGFVPGEKVKIIMTVDEVPYAFAQTGTGGYVTVNENGAFKLQPAGGIPTVLLKPGVYTIEAVGDKGSLASTPLEVLEKKQ